MSPAPTEDLRPRVLAAHQTLVDGLLDGRPPALQGALSRRFRRHLLALADGTPSGAADPGDGDGAHRLTAAEALELELARNAHIQALERTLAGALAPLRTTLLDRDRADLARLHSPDVLLRAFTGALETLALTLDERLELLAAHARGLAAWLREGLAATLDAVTALPAATAAEAADRSTGAVHLRPVLERLAARATADAALAAELLGGTGERPAVAQRLDLLAAWLATADTRLDDDAVFALIKRTLADADYLRRSIPAGTPASAAAEPFAPGAGFVAQSLAGLPVPGAEQRAAIGAQIDLARHRREDQRAHRQRLDIGAEIERLALIHALPPSGRRFLDTVWAPLLQRGLQRQPSATGGLGGAVPASTLAALDAVLAVLGERHEARVRELEAALNRLAAELLHAGLAPERLDGALQDLRLAYDERRRTATAPAPATPRAATTPGVSVIELPDPPA